MSSRNTSSRHFSRAAPRPRETVPPSPRTADQGSPRDRSRLAGLRESLPFFLVGGVALAAALTLIAMQSPSAVGRLPVWTFLLAIGSISLVGGTVASLVGEPITDLPGENELVGQDLIVVSRSRWNELHRMEEWVGGRLSPTEPAPRPAATTAPVATPTAASPVIPPVPTLDELLADLPIFPDSAGRSSDPWAETEDSREAAPPPKSPAPPAPIPRASPGPIAPPPRAPVARPPKAPVPTASPPKPVARPARKAAARPGAKAEAVSDAELERLLTDLESEATKAMQERNDVPALIEPGVLTCAHCQRGIGITEKWESCEECLATYCENCASELAQVEGRRLCPACRHLGHGVRR
ncbi:MAG: hypothetical protein L3J73_04290 [Thermoplasmata archaeon]|nr:hypothetical protein [Thermoplasmata archaeon]